MPRCGSGISFRDIKVMHTFSRTSCGGGGQSPMLQELGNVQSEARSMRRAAAIEKVLAEIGKPVSHFTSKSTASAEELDYEENR